MTALIFGVGLGLFVVLSLWFFAALIFFVSLRIEKRIGVLAVFSALVLTVVLVGVPRSPEKDVVYENKPYDHLFIWRLILLALLVLSSFTGLYGYIKFSFAEPARPQRIKSWVY